MATDVTEAPGCRRLDVTDEKEWAELAAELKASYGQVHGLVNNAGMAVAQKNRSCSPLPVPVLIASRSPPSR
ncbi:SDR family oxidoreductase [Streptomyces sp. NPDC088747]|uniref:SDR family oxidoreductase n=1 Tax=Streptomyces sp. NPDC088747 TaxID=3365886 RepID=UPI0037F726C9